MTTSVFTPDYYKGEHYPKYFLTPHWKQLKEDLIYSNPDAKCWICSKKNTLLIHHERYDNLFHEELFRDIFILCFNCHTQLHFRKFLFIFNWKTKLTVRELKKRRLILKYNYCLQNNQYRLSLWYLLLSTVT